MKTGLISRNCSSISQVLPGGFQFVIYVKVQRHEILTPSFFHVSSTAWALIAPLASIIFFRYEFSKVQLPVHHGVTNTKGGK